MRHLQHRPLVAPLSLELPQEGQETTLPATPVAVLELVTGRVGNRGISQGLAGAGGFEGAAAETLSRALAGVDDAEWLRGGNQAALARLRTGGGAPLPAAVAQRMEAAFGHDFSAVRIHTGAEAAQQAQALSARAFAMGDHVFFGRGAWAPGTPAGDRVLVHELTHVVQHHEGRLPKTGGVSSPTDPHEREAVAAEDALLAELDGLLAEGGGAWAAQGEALPETEAAGPTEGAELSRSAEEAPAEGAPAEGEQKEEGEDAGMLIELVRMVSPELADLMEMGMPALLEMLRAEIEKQVEAMWSGVEGMDFFAQLSAPLGESADALASGAAADPNCCEALPAWLSSLRDMAQWWSADGPFAMVAGLGERLGHSVFGALDWVMNFTNTDLKISLLAPIAGAVLSGCADGLKIIGTLDYQMAQAVAEFFGFDATGETTFDLIQKATEIVLGGTARMLFEPIAIVLRMLSALPGPQMMYMFIDWMEELSTEIAWLWEHIGDPDLMEKARTEMANTWIPAFIEKGTKLKPMAEGAWEGSLNGMLGLLACVTAAILPLASTEAFTFLKEKLDAMRKSIDMCVGYFTDLIAENSAALEKLDAFLLDLLCPYQFLLMLVGAETPSIASVFELILGSEIQNLPECYAAILFDIALDVMMAVGSSIVTMVVGILPGGPMMVDLAWYAMRTAISVAKALPAVDKQTFLVRIVDMTESDFGISLLAGLVWGVSSTIADTAKTTMDLIKALLEIPGAIGEFLLFLPLDILAFLMADYTPQNGLEGGSGLLGNLDDVGDAIYQKDEYGSAENDIAAGKERKKRAEEVKARTEAGKPPVAGILSLSEAFLESLGKTVSSLPELVAILGGAWALIETTFAQVGAEAMGAALEAFFHNAGDRSSFEIGESVGSTVAEVFGELILICGTAGLARSMPAVSESLRLILAALKAPEKVVEALMIPVSAMFGALGVWLDDLIAFASTTKLKAVEPIVTKLREFIASWKGFMDELKAFLGVAAEAPNAKAPDAKAPDAKAPDTAKTDAKDTDAKDTDAKDTDQGTQTQTPQAAEVKALADAAKAVKPDDLKVLATDILNEIDASIKKGVSVEDIQKVVDAKYKEVVDELTGAADAPGWLDPTKSPRDNILDEVKKRTKEELENQAKERAGQAEEEEKKEEEKKEEAPKTEGRPVEADEETHTLGHTCHREEEEKKD